MRTNKLLCLITKISWLHLFLLPRLVGFVFVGKLASSGAAFWTSILWRWKFRELPQSISSKREVGSAGSINILITGFWA
ncbi:hypothetical protein RX455_004182 [Vibrio fluvialis]|nr:hypothetical protein [Vibrio fluvialis]